jgi:hypothetical protein
MISHAVRKRSTSPQDPAKRQKSEIVLHLSNNSNDISHLIANGSVDAAKVQKLEARLGTLQPASYVENLEFVRESSAHSGDSEPTTTQLEQDLLDHEPTNPSTPEQTPGTKKKRKFTEEEDIKIQQGYEQFNGDWEQVAKWGWSQGERTSEQVKNRWKRLSKKKRPDDESLPTAVLATAGGAYRVGAPVSSPPQLATSQDKSGNTSPSKNRTIYAYFPRDVPKEKPRLESPDVARLHETILHLTQDKEDLMLQLSSVKQEAEQRIRAAEDGKMTVQERGRNVLVDLLLARARDKARDRRRRANENSMRLANMTVER